MIFFGFNDFEGFNEVFGVRETGNGEKVRRNKILLATYKNRKFVHWCLTTGNDKLLHATGLASFKRIVYEILERDAQCKAAVYSCELANGIILPQTNSYLDKRRGLCVKQEDYAKVRYYSVERQDIFCRKAGSYFRLAIEASCLNGILPEQAQRWLEEDFAQEWTAFAKSKVGDTVLHIGEEESDFARIYDSKHCLGNFHSCMVDQDREEFYAKYVKAKAAWIERPTDGMILARCIIFTEVYDGYGNKYRLAERQYSSEGDDTLKRELVQKLIDAGEIDGYKKVGADCHSARSFLSKDGDDWSCKMFHIHCSLGDGDTLSYQDSFKYFNFYEKVAYNTNFEGSCDLATTDAEFEYYNQCRCWSSYNREYIDQSEAYYDEVRGDYFYWDQVEYVNGLYRYSGDLVRCPECGEWIDPECWECCFYSELTEEHYCRESCLDSAEEDYKRENWYYSEYDNEYIEDRSEIITCKTCWNSEWNDYTVSLESWGDFVDGQCVAEIDGVTYVGTEEEIAELRERLSA